MEFIDLSGKILQGHGRYRIKRLIGYGAHGQVWEAWHDFLGKLLAIKVIDASSLEPTNLERIKRECSIGGELGEETGIVRVHDAFEEQDVFYIVMDLMEGGNLQKVVKENIPNLHTTIGWALILADALLKVHQHKIIHRDIKPQNILFSRAGQPRISDFGIAHIPTSSFTETQPGTPGYKAPELERGGEPSFASDVYSLGATLFEVWGNQAFAFYKSQPLDDLQKELIVLMEQAYPDAALQLRQELSSILIRSLNPDPYHRLELTELYNRLEMVQNNLKAQTEFQHLIDKASIKTIGDLFPSSFWKNQKMVARVSDTGSFEEDLEELIITQSFARDLRNILSYFLDDRWGSDESFSVDHFPVVWISGIFGSGKSLFAKIIAALLDNPKLYHLKSNFVDAFKKKLEQSNLSSIEDLQFLLDRLQSRYWCRVIPIGLEDHIIFGDGDFSFPQICLNALYESQGLSSIFWVAKLQQQLKIDNLYSDFLNHLPLLIGQEPENRLTDPILCEVEVPIALAKTMGFTRAEAENYINNLKNFFEDPDYIQQEIIDFLSKNHDIVQPLFPRLAFVIEGIDRIIFYDKQRVEEFQEFLKTIVSLGQGKIWVICVSQTKLFENSDRLKLLLNKVISPRWISIDLDEDYIFQVVMGLLSQKKKAGIARIHNLIQERSANVIQFGNLHQYQNRLGLESFAATYPFPPYTFPLLYALVGAFSTTHYLNSTRVLISLMGDVLRYIIDQPVGVLASFDLFYKPLKDNLQFTDKQFQQIPEVTLELSSPFSKRILKVLWLIQKVDWLPKTPDVMEILLVNRLDADLYQMKQNVGREIEMLLANGLIHRERNGEITIAFETN